MPANVVDTYGATRNLFVKRQTAESLIVGGVAEDTSTFSRVLSQRAALLLWFHLTRFLYPDKSPMITALGLTAPLELPPGPAVTTYISASVVPEGGFELTGHTEGRQWRMHLSTHEAQRLWTALDLTLYPLGWPARPGR